VIGCNEILYSFLDWRQVAQVPGIYLILASLALEFEEQSIPKVGF
jgi:hypothetical protein